MSELFPNSAFEKFEKHDYVIQINRNIDETIGNLFSMSWASKNILGSRVVDFENELRQKLKALPSSDLFVDKVKFRAYILIKK